jgi:putative ABC transport system permease protein
MSLIKNYFTSLFRNSMKDKFYSLLNLVGLGIGLACAIFIFMYVQDELSFDKYNENYERIYRLEGDFYISGKQDLMAITQIPLGPTLMDEYPEIEEAARILPRPSIYFRDGEDVFKEDSIAIADSTLFSIFTVDFIHGDKRTALTEPLTMVISRSMANKYFGRTDVINESLRQLDGSEYRITGVFRDLPQNTHLRYNGLISSKTIEEQIGSERFNDRSAPSFWNVAVFTFVKMAENTTPQMILDKFPAFYDKYMRELGDQIDASFDLRMTNLADLHYQEDELSRDAAKGNMNYIIILSVIAVFIVFIAIVNYINLTTARSASRSKEIGIRKVGGASKGALRQQFIGESLMTAVFAGILATLFVLLFIPLFNNFSEKSFSLSILLQPEIILFIAGLTLVTGLLSGVYPAYYLASFNPVSIIKGASTGKSEKGILRKGLVISQFVISAFMIIGSIVVAVQLNYIRNKPLGFVRENIIALQLNDSAITNNLEAFKEELKRSPDIKGVALSTTLPGRFFGKRVMMAENENNEMIEKAFDNIFVDYDFIDLYEIKIKPGGRNFSKDFGSDQQSSFIVNEALGREMNHGEASVGKRFRPGVFLNGQGPPEGEIIGVVEDFHYASLHNPVGSLVLLVNDNVNFMRTLSVKYMEGKSAEVLEWITTTRDSFNATFPLEYSFLEEDLDELYSQERIIFTLFIAFTAMVLVISAIGLLGLSAFMTAKRTRETGIRRVMGASQQQILNLFLTEFSKWVLISNVLAWPISWWVMTRWLENFEFRRAFPFWTFAVSLAISVIIALITVSWQSIRAARMNPASSIRVE